MDPELRRAARIIVVDPHGRVLLFLHARPNGEPFWALPGGGLEHDETFQQAAAREATEELGIGSVPLTPLWEGEVDFAWGERLIHQQEQYFLLRSQPQAFPKTVREVHRQEGILEFRWWSVAALEQSTALIFPEDLAKNLRKTLPLEEPE